MEARTRERTGAIRLAWPKWCFPRQRESTLKSLLRLWRTGVDDHADNFTRPERRYGLSVAILAIIHPVKQGIKHKPLTEQANHKQCNHKSHRRVLNFKEAGHLKRRLGMGSGNVERVSRPL